MKHAASKRILSILLTAAMLVSLMPAAFAGELSWEESFAEEEFFAGEPALLAEDFELQVSDGLEEDWIVEAEDAGADLWIEESDGEEARLSESGGLEEEIRVEAPAEEEPGLEVPDLAEPDPEASEEEKSEEPVAVSVAVENGASAQSEAEDKRGQDAEDRQEADGEQRLFPGMPEGYTLSADELARKQDLFDHEVPQELAKLIPGQDYPEGEIIFLADSAEYAEMTAEAYDAELISLEYGVAVARLRNATTLEAVTAAADMRLPLPVVEANLICRLVEDGAEEDAFLNAASSVGEEVPEIQSWTTWRDRLGENFDPYLKNIGKPNGTYQYMHEKIHSYEAWGVSRGAGITVAVIDSGVDVSHPELAGRAVDVGTPYSGRSIDHGTHVAGIIAAALGNGQGGAGVAPEATIRSYNVFGTADSYQTANLIKGINAAVRDRVDIINMSLYSFQYESSLKTTLENAIKAGVTIVSSMNNFSSNIMTYPAGYDLPGMIAVGSLTRDGARSFFTCYGPWEDIAAPGSGILSTIPGNGYGVKSGTSMSSPVVAGACALYMSYYGHTSPANMESVIRSASVKGTLDLSKLFAKDLSEPEIRFRNGSRIVSGTVPSGSIMELFTRLDDDEFIVYTLDGKAPAVKDGKIAYGTLYDGYPIPMTQENGFTAGKKTTVKALRVNGRGAVSKTATASVTVGYAAAEDMEILFPRSQEHPELPFWIESGKSVTLQARVWPEEAAQTVKWAIDWANSEGRLDGCSVNAKTGAVKTGKNDSGTLCVTATSADGECTTSCKIYVLTRENTVAKKLTLSDSSLILPYFTEEDAQVDPPTCTLEATALTASGKPPLLPAQITWTSSNVKVATVDEYGTVTAVAPGKAVITAKTANGGNASARCNVTVQQMVTELTITGPGSVLAGSSATYKAAVQPAKAGNKNVFWSLRGAPSGVSIDARGRLTVASKASGTFDVVASAADDGGASASLQVTIRPKAKAVSVYEDDAPLYGSEYRTYNSDGTLKQATLFSVEPGWSITDAPSSFATISLLSRTLFENGANLLRDGVVWSSSNNKVASVDEDGVVTAHQAGTTTITCKANDSSGKKATVSVKVINPVSDVAIVNTTQTTKYGDVTIAVGKSVSNKVVFGDAFGKPTVTKVTWGVAAEVDGDYDYGKALIDNGLITISKDGKLTASKNLSGILAKYENVYICVYADAADGSARHGELWYTLTCPITKAGIPEFWVKGNGSRNILTSVSITMEKNKEYSAPIWTNASSQKALWDRLNFAVKSSNPKVAGGSIVWNNEGGVNYPCIVVNSNGGQTGSARITVTATDGSNKSFTINVTVKK